MRGALGCIGGTAVLVTVLLGCGTYPLPRIAVQGTTITIPVPDVYGTGFGRVLNPRLDYGETVAANLPIAYPAEATKEDEQRGELLFALHSSNSHTSGFVTYLPVRWITRVQLDEGSPAALPAAGESWNFEPSTNPVVGQTVAAVDIPASVPPTDYWIFVERWWRDTSSLPTSAQNFVERTVRINNPLVPWLGWTGSGPQTGIPIQITLAPQSGTRFTDFDGWDKWFGTYSARNFINDLDGLTPRPKLLIWLDNISTTPVDPPAAWEAQLQYPREKIEVLGVELTGAKHRSGAIVTIQRDSGALMSCVEPTQATTKIMVVDPSQSASSVQVVYRPRNFAQCGRAVAGDFTIAAGSFKGYDVNGNLMAPYYFVNNAYSFPESVQ